MLLIAGLLVFGAQVAPAHGLKFNFTAEVEQCKPFTISFAGSSVNSVPAFLSMISVNSTAISVPLRDPFVVSTGIALTFLPFPAGADFIASLDDSTGGALISVSDLKRVLPSSTDNSSCLPPPVAKRFAISTPVSQCEGFTINYDTSAVFRAPTVRLYSPTGPSFLLNSTSDNATVGTATYMMNFGRGKELILLVEDGGTIRETSPLMTVLGNNASSTECLKRSAPNTPKSTPTDVNDINGTPVGGRAAIIGGATAGSAVALIGLCMAIFVVRDRRRCRKIQGAKQLPPMGLDDEKSGSAQGQFPDYSANRAVNNPIYTTTSFFSPTRSNFSKGSIASWGQIALEDHRYPSNSTPSPSEDIVQVPRSLQPLDIEAMLNMATLQSDESPSRKNPEATALGPPSVTVQYPTFLRPEINLRHFRDPSDVPVGANSMAFSEYSVNPFEGHESNPNDGPSARYSGAGAGIP